MSYSITKKKIASVLFVAIMLSVSLPSITLYDAFADNNLQIEKADSTQVNATGKKVNEVQQSDEKAHHVKSPSSLSYNIVYFLISKFIKANPLSKPR